MRGGRAIAPAGRGAVAGLLATAALAACSSDPGGVGVPGPPAPSAGGSSGAGPVVAGSLDGLVGPGCPAYLAAHPRGAGSIAVLAHAPVAAATAHDPLLKTLGRAVSGRLNPDVDLVGELDDGEYTLFAPVDDAFVKLPAATVTVLAHNRRRLTRVLRYHLVTGRLSPSEIAGTRRTVEGGTLEVTDSGGSLRVNGAQVICGGLRTANATVYLIDAVLTPPKA